MPEIGIADLLRRLDPVTAGHRAVGDVVSVLALRKLHGLFAPFSEGAARGIERWGCRLGTGDRRGCARCRGEIVGCKGRANVLVAGEELFLGRRETGRLRVMFAVALHGLGGIKTAWCERQR